MNGPNRNCVQIAPVDDPDLSARKEGGWGAKAPGEERGRCMCGAEVEASLLPLPEGVLLCLFSLFAVFDALGAASLVPPGGDLALPPPLTIWFPLLSTLSSCEYALAGLSICPGVLDPPLISRRPVD